MKIFKWLNVWRENRELKEEISARDTVVLLQKKLVEANRRYRQNGRRVWKLGLVIRRIFLSIELDEEDVQILREYGDI